MKVTGINPTTGEALDSYPEMSGSDIEERLKQSARQFAEWKRTSFAERGQRMKAVGKELRAGRSKFAQLMAREMGKPVSQGNAEIDKCATTCEYYADHAEKFLQPEIVKSDASKSFIAFEPLGVLFAIMPW